MIQTQVIEGTWDEVREPIARLAREHAGERVRLVVTLEPVVRPARNGPSAEETIRVLDEPAGRNGDQPATAPDALARGEQPARQPPYDPNHFYFRATPEEFQRALDAISEGSEGLPVLPPEAFERESLYDDRW